MLPGWFLAVALLCALPVGSPATARWLGYGGAALGGLIGLVGSAAILLTNTSVSLPLVETTAWLAVGLRVDALGAAFAVPLSAATSAVSVAAIGYASAYDHRGGARLASLFNLFVGAMLLVLVADGPFAFLIAWEVMSLVGYFLVTHEHERRDVRRAGFVYLAMAQIGTAFLIGAFCWLLAAGGGPSTTFQALSNAAARLDPLARDLVFLAVLIGFGTKAGLMPLHAWLPRAHPVAPSHVSALMSGVMLKVAIYGFARVAFGVLGVGPAWWGWLVLAVGLASAVLGVLYALMEHDLKRLLAYHSVENIGIITIGLGATLVFRSQAAEIAATLALTAALFHTLNHALFKSLLFVGAGAVDRAAGTRDLEHLGGLGRRMPQTSALFLVGAAAISALPPLNGFASEWLTLQALLALSTIAPVGLTGVAGLGSAALLAMTGGLAAACFVKAFGVAFLGLPRSHHAEQARESPRSVRLGMALLAAACVVLGLLPGLAPALFQPAAAFAIAAPSGEQLAAEVSGVRGAILIGWPVLAAQSAIVPSVALAVGLVIAALAWSLLRLLGPVPVRRGAVWVCGFGLEPRMQYGSTAFAEPLRLFFRMILRPQRATAHDWALPPYFPVRLTTRGSTLPLIERHLYSPTMHLVLRAANGLRLIQSGSLRTYLLYVFATLLVLLVVTR